MKNARVLVGLVLGLSVAGCTGEGAPTGEPEIETVQSALVTNAKVNVGGPGVADTPGRTTGVSGPFAIDPLGGGNIVRTNHTITVAGVTFAAPQAVYQSARLGTFTYTVSGLPANAAVAVRLHFAEIVTTIGGGQRLVNVAISGVNVISKLDVFKTAGGPFLPIVQQVAGKASAGGSVTIAVSGATGNRGLLSGYEVWVIDCGPPSAPVGGTVTATKTIVGGVATYHCPTTDVLVGNATRTCTQLGTSAGWNPAAPVCLIKQGQGCGSSNACASGFCVGGMCCQSACNGPCDKSNVCDSGGHCVPDVGRQCRTVTGSNPGNNDFQLFCNGNGACVGPTFTCGNSGNTCGSDGTTACCARAIVMDGTTTWTDKDCGAASTCAGNYGENCLNATDCPTGKECCFSGGYGFGWSVCVAAGTCDAGRLVCDPSRPPVVCPGGTSCQGYNGTENTCQQAP